MTLTSQRSLVSLELCPSLVPLEYRGEVIEEWFPGFGAQQDVVADVMQRVPARLHFTLECKSEAAVARAASE